jgi:hypothetical protein
MTTVGMAFVTRTHGVERDYLSVFAAVVVYPDLDVVGDEEFFDLSVDLTGRHWRTRRLLLIAAARARLPGGVRVVLRADLLVVAAFGGRVEVDRHGHLLADQHDLPPHLIFHARQIRREIGRRRPLRQNHQIGLGGHHAIGSRRPGEHLARELIFDR